MNEYIAQIEITRINGTVKTTDINYINYDSLQAFKAFIDATNRAKNCKAFYVILNAITGEYIKGEM